MALPDQGYLSAINNAPKVRLVIMGRDWYPTDPFPRGRSIPFLKETWAELQAHDCSGGKVLQSLGFRIAGVNEGELLRRYGAPHSLFLRLAESGIAFLNVVYPDSALTGRIVLRDHLDDLKMADLVNAPICERAWLTVLCGEANKRRWLDSHRTTACIEAVHPEKRCENHPNEGVRRAWAHWWSMDAIFNWVKPVTELHDSLTRLREGR